MPNLYWKIVKNKNLPTLIGFDELSLENNLALITLSFDETSKLLNNKILKHNSKKEYNFHISYITYINYLLQKNGDCEEIEVFSKNKAIDNAKNEASTKTNLENELKGCVLSLPAQNYLSNAKLDDFHNNYVKIKLNQILPAFLKVSPY